MNNPHSPDLECCIWPHDIRSNKSEIPWNVPISLNCVSNEGMSEKISFTHLHCSSFLKQPGSNFHRISCYLPMHVILLKSSLYVHCKEEKFTQ